MIINTKLFAATIAAAKTAAKFGLSLYLYEKP